MDKGVLDNNRSVSWNRLPARLKLPLSILVFKRKIKKYLRAHSIFKRFFFMHSGLIITVIHCESKSGPLFI